MEIFRIWTHVESANRWVTEFENEVTGLAREMDQFVPMFIMTEVDIVLLIFITRADPFGYLKLPGAI